MVDSQDREPQVPEKGRKNRSFGAFLLFLTILVAVLIFFGNQRWTRPVQLTQDQYEYHLYSAQIDSQEMRGDNQIEGEFKYPVSIDGNKYKTFKVSFAGLEPNQDKYRELKAIPAYKLVNGADLEAALADGVYEATLARQVTSFKEKPAPPSAESDGPSMGESQGSTIQREQLFVQVYAPSEDAWRAENNGDPLYPLPTVSGTLSLEVENFEDLWSLVGTLKSSGAAFEHKKFDLRPGKGTQWLELNNLLTTVLLVYGPWILIFVVFLLFMRQMRSQGGAGGVMSFGRSRAQLYSKENHTNVTFDDIAGAQEAKEEVREVVEFLKNPNRFTRIGGRIPRGVLLVGSPGCGKTLLAKAIAGEAEVPFFSISGSDFVEMFVGVGASRVRDLFKQARENSPCIIFLDEIDAVGRRRGSGMGGGHDEREQTLNAILVEMDGFGTDEGIIVIAATNRPDVLDPALLRPGRFDREVTIDLPDMEGREEILRVHLKKVKAGTDVDLQTLARSTPGYSGADLAAIINEAAIRAALSKRDQISMDDLEESRDKVRYGRQKKSRKLEEEDRKITAYHEAGHAIVAARLDKVEDPHKVTIVPRGRALGATMVLPDKESYHMQKGRMLGQLAMLFGGRVAEAEFCGDISAGASDDIKRATDLARAMITELGMSDAIGPVNYSERQGSDFLGTELMRGRAHSEETAREIDEEVHRVLDKAYEEARTLIQENRAYLETLAQSLLAYETVSGTDVERILGGASVEDLRPDPEPQQEPEPQGTRVDKIEKTEAENDSTGELPGEPGLSPA